MKKVIGFVISGIAGLVGLFYLFVLVSAWL